MPHGTPEYATLLAPRYRLVREIGGGTMASVWLAEDTRHARQVAVKVLRPEYSATFAAERFLREIEIAARLQHPHIVPLLDSGEAGGLLYLVMPFIEGESLRQRLQREGRLPPSDVIRILADVADALAYAHDKGVLHRDIKPDNILLAGRHALVTDFGVAKAASLATSSPQELTGALAIGTPAYMAPEQALAEPDLDARVDLYALSIVGYELLTGTPPFHAPTAQQVLTAQVLDAPAPILDQRPDTPPALATLLERGLAKPRDERWPGAHALVQALEPLATPSGGTTPAGVAPIQRRPSPVWLAAGAVVLAGLAIGGYLARPERVNLQVTERQLTFSGEVRSAAISPDGQFLAYVADSAASAWLMVQDTKGGRAINLARAGRMGLVSWSADGAEVRAYSYDAGSNFLQRVPRLGGPAIVTQVFPWSMPSPDGRRMFDLPQGRPLVRVRDLATGDSVAAEREKGWWYGPPSWSADGAWVAAASFRETGVMGRLVLFSTTDLHAVVALEDSVALGSPAWDGREHALYYLRGGSRLVDLYRLQLGNDGKAAGPPVLIRAGLSTGNNGAILGFSAPVSVSSDGRMLVYTQQHEWSNIGIIAIRDWQKGGAPVSLTTGSSLYRGARVSPDGNTIALLRDETDATVLQLLTRAGVPQEVARFHEALGGSWSRDGRRFVVETVAPDSGTGVRIFTLDDQGTHSLYAGQVGDYPEWLDDSSLVAPSPGNRFLRRLPLRGGMPSALPGIDTAGWMLWPRRSPDGALLLYSWNTGRGQQLVQLYRIRDTAAQTFWSGSAKPVGWSADSRVAYLLHTSGDSDQVLAVPVGGGPPRVVAAFPASLEVLEVTPDGERILLNQLGRQADAWLLRVERRP